MERLTKKDKYKLSSGEEIVLCEHLEDDCNDSCMKIRHCTWYEKAMEKLKHYEDLEEYGRLIKLSCKVGDTIWYVDEDDDEYPIELEIDVISKNDSVIWYYADDDNYGKLGFTDSDFGKTVFLTKSEAEAKLEELVE